MLHVIDAEYLEDYRVKVIFNDGKTGIADLSLCLSGEIFEDLKNKRRQYL